MLEKIGKIVDGKKTYIGIIITIIGLTGISKYVTPDELTIILNGVFNIAGIIMIIIGVIHKIIKKYRSAQE